MGKALPFRWQALRHWLHLQAWADYWSGACRTVGTHQLDRTCTPEPHNISGVAFAIRPGMNNIV
jgi:hypothetical protein